MQPLKLLAIVIGTLPLAAFLLTLYLTDGAPLQPFTPGQESGPAAATPALPQADLGRPRLERQTKVAAAGYPGVNDVLAGTSDFDLVFPPKQLPAPVSLVNGEREAQIFLMLFGVPDPYFPPAP